jgi:hypothetical protein
LMVASLDEDTLYRIIDRACELYIGRKHRWRHDDTSENTKWLILSIIFYFYIYNNADVWHDE